MSKSAPGKNDHKLAASSKQKNSVFYFAAVGVPFTKPESDENDG
jgi:hypothetical protein